MRVNNYNPEFLMMGPNVEKGVASNEKHNKKRGKFAL